MSKVGILSMQRIANYGSFLQAYGLKSILEELGCEVEFVDYHPGNTLLPADGGTGIKRKISKTLEVFRYSAPLKEKIRFIKYKKNYAANYYPYLGIDEKMNYTPELDVLVIGSDEVFNCVQNNTNVGFAPELFGDGHCAQRLISYAASFGNTTEEKLRKHGVEKQVGLWLKKFDAISVRDENSGEVVKKVTGIEPFFHLDPVLAYDFVGKCKDIPNTVSEEKYLILYGYSGRFSKEECDYIKGYARKNALRILCIGGVQDACDRFVDCNPFEVLAYFKNAECVITDTFHGTIMSIITHRKFVSFIRKSGYGNYEKMTDLLKRVHLTGRAIDHMEDMEKFMSEDIDYKFVDEVIKKEREKSYHYLREEIEKVCIQN